MHRGYRHIVLAIGLIALLCAPALGQEGQPQGIGENEEAGEQAQEDRPSDTAVEDQIVSPVEAPQAEFAASDAEGDDQAAEQHQTQQPVFDWRAFVSAKDTLAQWIMAAFGVVATGVSIWAIILLRRTLRESRRATKAALRAAEAAGATVDVTRDIGQRQIRAYVISDPNFEWGHAYRDRPKNIVGYNFNMKWRNCGLTPARRCRSRVSLGVFDELLPRDFSYADKAAPEITDTNYIGPNQIILSRVGGFKLGDADVVQRGEKHLYIWGWTEYDDVFGGVRRRTEFCYRIRIDWDEDGKIVFIPIVSGPFNGADEDCHHQTKT